MQGKTLTEGTPWKLILAFAMPVLFGLLLQQLYNTVDTIIVGNFASEAALSAVGTTGCLTMLFLAIANGFSAGAGVIIAQLYGAEKIKELKRNAVTSVLLLLGMGVVASIIGIILCASVFRFILAVPDSLLGMAVIYFRIYAVGVVFQFGYNIVAAILRAVGDSKASLYFLLIASVINIILDIVFVAGFHWGAAGAAIATDIAQAASCAAAVWYMWKKYPVFRWNRAELKFEGKIAAQVLKVGFPMALQQAVVSFGFIFIQRAVNGYGQTMTASFTVGQRIEMYLNMPLSAFQVTMATYVGQNMGAGNLDRIKKGARQTVILSEVLTVCISIIVFLTAGNIVALFGLGEQATVYCIQHIRCMAFLMLILAAYFPILGLFQGAGDGFAATVVATVALSVRVITTYTLCHLPIFGYRIIWWNALFGFLFGITITWTHYLRGKWKGKVVVELK